MNKRDEIIKEFCKIASCVAVNLRKVRTFDDEEMKNIFVREHTISDCFCEHEEWEKYNKVDNLVVDFIKKAVEYKIHDLDIKHDTDLINKQNRRINNV